MSLTSSQSFGLLDILSNIMDRDSIRLKLTLGVKIEREGCNNPTPAIFGKVLHIFVFLICQQVLKTFHSPFQKERKCYYVTFFLYYM